MHSSNLQYVLFTRSQGCNMESLNIHLSWAPLRSVTFKPPTTRLTGSDRYVKPNTLGFEDHLYLHFQDLKTALDKDHMPALPTNDLRKTKAAFIEEAVKVMNASNDGSELLSSRDKYLTGMSMWMNSATRAVLMAGKKPGFAAVTDR